jgi:hypothetical protein
MNYRFRIKGLGLGLRHRRPMGIDLMIASQIVPH